MALSRQVIPSDGNTDEYAISFADGYLSRDEIKVYEEFLDDTPDSPIDFTFINDYLIRLNRVPPVGSNIVIERVVDASARKVNFIPQYIKSSDLNTMYKHLLYLAQAILDGRWEGTFGTNLDMGGNRIINVGAPVDDNDAVRLIDISTYTNQAKDLLAQTQASQAAAKVSETNSKASEIAAKSNETAAASSAAAAKQSEDNAADSAEEAKQYATKASFGNIGDIQYTTRTDVPNGGAWCDGAEYTQAAFPDLYQMLVEGKISSTDYSTFNNSVSTNGACGLFALDIEATSFKVPLLKDIYLKAGQAPSMFGAESLPNIKGYASSFSGDNVGYLRGANQSGCLYTSENRSQVGPISGSTNTDGRARLNIDASRSSSAYQDGAKVNPNHVVYRAYVVLYSSAAEASEVQAAEFMTALASKANADMSNVDSEWVSSASKPSDKVVVLTVQANTARYTAPANGWVSVVQDNNAVGHANLYRVRGGLGMMIRIDANGAGKVYIPVSKGEQFVYDYVGRNPSGMNNSFIFTYDEGAK